MSLSCRVCRRNSATRAASPSLQVRTLRLREGELGCSRVRAAAVCAGSRVWAAAVCGQQPCAGSHVRAAVWPGLRQLHAESFRGCDALTATQEAEGQEERRVPWGPGRCCPRGPLAMPGDSVGCYNSVWGVFPGNGHPVGQAAPQLRRSVVQVGARVPSRGAETPGRGAMGGPPSPTSGRTPCAHTRGSRGTEGSPGEGWLLSRF